MKKYLIPILSAAMLLTGVVALAETNCDNQPKPAKVCPAGYTMQCIPTGGDHWGCAKQSNGLFIEVSEASSASTGAGSIQGTVKGEAEVSTGTTSSKDWEGFEEDDEKNSNAAESKTEVVTKGGSTVSVPSQAAAKIIVSGWDPEKKEAIEAKVKMQTAKDASLKSVEITQGNVTVVYASRAKLFAIFPITMNINVSSDVEGKVKVKFPWYHFLTTSTYTVAETKLNAIFQHNESNMEFLKTKGSAEAQAQIFVMLSDGLFGLK